GLAEPRAGGADRYHPGDRPARQRQGRGARHGYSCADPRARAEHGRRRRPRMSQETLAYEDALRIVLAAGSKAPVEDVPISACIGRVLAAPVISAVDLPPFDNSAMDGFALR